MNLHEKDADHAGTQFGNAVESVPTGGGTEMPLTSLTIPPADIPYPETAVWQRLGAHVRAVAARRRRRRLLPWLAAAAAVVVVAAVRFGHIADPGAGVSVHTAPELARNPTTTAPPPAANTDRTLLASVDQLALQHELEYVLYLCRDVGLTGDGAAAVSEREVLTACRVSPEVITRVCIGHL